MRKCIFFSIGLVVLFLLNGCVSDDALVKRVSANPDVDLSSFRCLYFSEFSASRGEGLNSDQTAALKNQAEVSVNEGLSAYDIEINRWDCSDHGQQKSVVIKIHDGEYSMQLRAYEKQTNDRLFYGTAKWSYWAIVGGFRHDAYQGLGARLGLWLSERGYSSAEKD